ncbi:hypothetical protein BV25DRAFT_1823253 [Artomyces pyxidatus]|uniref:Uncharacterized protein n=1 Tax=Artomyces pyxidatus TaxID=48021 RepID=A0ACB8T600_9AGAM|nr:hypothetical protein BV25DRAFT_1823253 [Artomyces pyxidatus]
MNESLFDGCAPRLRHLSIYGCSFSWQSPILRHLISLTIERVAAIPLQTFVSAMQKLASMKVLVLKYCLPSLEDDIPPSSSPFSLVDFSNLAELTLCDNMDFVTRFLARTRMSGETRLEITCLSLARNTNDIATFVTVLEHTGFFSLESALPITHIVHHPTDVEAEVRAWRAPSPNTFATNGYQRKHSIADLVLVLFVGLEHDTQGEQHCPSLMAAIHHAIPGEHLLEFEVHCNGWCGVNWTPHAWFDILGDAYNIRRVLIGGAFAPPFFSALSLPISDAETAAKSLFLPRLLSLDIGFVLRLHVPAEALLYDELLTAL